ncbi:9258_t:CDS:2, partial [Funneliformis caledonium]
NAPAGLRTSPVAANRADRAILTLTRARALNRDGNNHDVSTSLTTEEKFLFNGNGAINCVDFVEDAQKILTDMRAASLGSLKRTELYRLKSRQNANSVAYQQILNMDSSKISGVNGKSLPQVIAEQERLEKAEDYKDQNQNQNQGLTSQIVKYKGLTELTKTGDEKKDKESISKLEDAITDYKNFLEAKEKLEKLKTTLKIVKGEKLPEEKKPENGKDTGGQTGGQDEETKKHKYNEKNLIKKLINKDKELVEKYPEIEKKESLEAMLQALASNTKNLNLSNLNW